MVEVSELMSNQRRIVERSFEEHDGSHVATTTVVQIPLDLYIFPLLLTNSRSRPTPREEAGPWRI